MNLSDKKCLVIGGSGYLGTELANYLRAAGWRVVLTSRSSQRKGEISYSLGGDLDEAAFDGVTALVHCAYDFGPSSWNEIYRNNVLGTKRLLEQTTRAGIKNIITISSISAFPDCSSYYGKAKLLIEAATREAGGIVLRPGLIYGGANRGMYGKLQRQVQGDRLIPLIAASDCNQFLVHSEDLCRLIDAILSGKIPKPRFLWTVAHSEAWPLKRLLLALAGPRRVRFLPVPWQVVWFGLRSLEVFGLRFAFKSDSVWSLAHQNPKPDFEPIITCGLPIRPFKPE